MQECLDWSKKRDNTKIDLRQLQRSLTSSTREKRNYTQRALKLLSCTEIIAESAGFYTTWTGSQSGPCEERGRGRYVHVHSRKSASTPVCSTCCGDGCHKSSSICEKESRAQGLIHRLLCLEGELCGARQAVAKTPTILRTKRSCRPDFRVKRLDRLGDDVHWSQCWIHLPRSK